MRGCKEPFNWGVTLLSRKAATSKAASYILPPFLTLTNITSHATRFACLSTVSNDPLLAQPVSMCVFYTSDSKSSTPAVGIAAGPYVFIYRHLRPYFKFTLPFIELDPQDESIWSEMMSENIDAEAGWDMLRQARASGATLSSWSLDLLALEDPERR